MLIGGTYLMCSLMFFHAAHLGDFDPELHQQSTEYITEFKFIPNQVILSTLTEIIEFCFVG